MSSNNDAKKLASSRGKPYSVYWKTSETHSRSSKTAGKVLNEIIEKPRT